MISACAELSQRIVFNQPLHEEKTGLGSWMSLSKRKEANTNTLVVVGYVSQRQLGCDFIIQLSSSLTNRTYSIGKERVVKGTKNYTILSFTISKGEHDFF